MSYHEQNIGIEVGYGECTFSMSRGSFKIKDKVFTTQKLVPRKRNLFKDHEELTYQNNKNKVVLALGIQDTNENETQYSFYPRAEETINRYMITFPIDPTDRIFGCGEMFTKLNLRGEKVRVWVAEHQTAKRISRKVVREKLLGKTPKKVLRFSEYETYYAQPTFVIAGKEKRYVHVDGSDYMEFDFTSKNSFTLKVHGNCKIYIGYAENFSLLSTNLSNRLGRQKALPEWIYDGAILGMQGGTQTVLEKLQKAKEANVAIAGIWCQDWEGCRVTKFGYQLMWNWKWDEALYPNLDKKMKEWEQEGIRFLGYINPFLAIEKELYQEAKEKGYCVKNKAGEDYQVTITTFPAAMVDFTNPDAYEWMKHIIKENLIAFGLKGWMADFGEYLPCDSVLYSGEDPKKIHNKWPAIWAKLNKEAIEESGLDEEIFFFARAGYTESIRYSKMMWNGDQHVDWSMDDGLPSVIPATLSLAMSGFGITHSDAGGYTTMFQIKREEELLMRWVELSTFSPLLRTHEGNQPGNNVQYDSNERVLKHFAKMSQMHQKLAPYLKHYIKETETLGIPLMRPLFYHYEEEAAFNESYEYLLGRDILVAPVLEKGKTEQTVYLPSDQWMHMITKEIYAGGRVNVKAPLGCPPVFIRSDSLWRNQLNL